MKRRMPSISGLVGALKRSDSQNKNQEEAGAAGPQSARGPTTEAVDLKNQKPPPSKPPKFTLKGIKGHIRNKLSQGGGAEKKDENAAKPKNSDSSSSESDEDLTNIIPNTLREQGPEVQESKAFLLKIEYLERENRGLQSQVNFHQNDWNVKFDKMLESIEDLKQQLSE